MMLLSATGGNDLIRDTYLFFIKEMLCEQYQLMSLFHSEPDETFVEEEIIN